MRTTLTMTLILALVSGPTFAATAQQERMKSCNVDAKTKELKGDARKAFMSTCLKGDTAGAKGQSPQARMKSCNKDAGAKSLKGDERKAFMSSCLKG
jgi:hypothetical protein